MKDKQRKTLFSYHGFVYSCTQLTNIPKQLLKRKDTNIERHLVLGPLNIPYIQSCPRKSKQDFYYLKYDIESHVKKMHSIKDLTRDEIHNAWNPVHSTERAAKKILTNDFEPLVTKIKNRFDQLEKNLVTEMKEDLRYVTSLEDEFDEKCLILDIQNNFSQIK